MSTLEVKELSHPAGQVIKIASGKTLDLNSQGTLVLPTIPHAKMPSGSVLQVINATHTSEVSNSTNTFQNTGLTATITPSSTTSKILVMVNQNGIFKSSSSANNALGLKLLRGSTDISVIASNTGYTATAIQNYDATISTSYLDSPSTTSATTYKTQFRSANNTSVVAVQRGSTNASTITLMEIQG